MSTLQVDTILAKDGTQTTEPSIPALDKRMAAAWVNFDGTGTVAIRKAYNVSSITDNGVGDYTVNFATPMLHADFAVAMSARRAVANEDFMAAIPFNGTPHTVNSCRVITTAASTYLREDSPLVSLVVFA